MEDRNRATTGAGRRAVTALVAWVALVATTACDGNVAGPGDAVTAAFDFTASDHGWTAGFADYPPDWAARMELASGYETLPAGIGRSGKGLFSGGTNHSDDLFMFWKGRVQGLAPGTTYRVRFEVEFASSAPSGCMGIGGAPAEAVHVKIAATVAEPVAAVVQDMDGDYYRLNIDKSDQAGSGEDAFVIGHVGTSNEDCHAWRWELVTLDSGAAEYQVTTDTTGALWLLVGTDSGFEGRTEVYYTRVRATFERARI
jgi:hypothetical protein